MASNIVSWGGNGHIVSPVLSSTTPSIVSVDSILPYKPETSTAVQGASCTTHPRADGAGDSFIRHHKYFFEDGNVTFLVDGTLYCVHRYHFTPESIYFSTRFDQLGIRDHEALPITISLGNIERRDFDAFLSIRYPKNIEQHDLSYEEWKSVLHLSTRWDFPSIRRLAMNKIQPPTPHDRLLLARTYSVNDWVIPALYELCLRSVPPTLDESRQMDIEDVVLVATVREDIRNHALQVNAAETPHCVETGQAGNLVPLAVLTSGTVEPKKQASNGYESDGESVNKHEAQEDVDLWKESLAQLMEDNQADVAARYKARVEAVRHMVKEAERKAEAEETKRRDETAKCEAEAARVAELEAEVARLQAMIREAERKVQTTELAGSSVAEGRASRSKKESVLRRVVY